MEKEGQQEEEDLVEGRGEERKTGGVEYRRYIFLKNIPRHTHSVLVWEAASEDHCVHPWLELLTLPFCWCICVSVGLQGDFPWDEKDFRYLMFTAAGVGSALLYFYFRDTGREITWKEFVHRYLGRGMVRRSSQPENLYITGRCFWENFWFCPPGGSAGGGQQAVCASHPGAGSWSGEENSSCSQTAFSLGFRDFSTSTRGNAFVSVLTSYLFPRLSLTWFRSLNTTYKLGLYKT